MSDKVPTIYGYPNNTRAEHLANCKAVALWTLDHPRGGVSEALGSMLSDMGKHPETANHAGLELQLMLQVAGHLTTKDEVRKHIEGFK